MFSASVKARLATGTLLRANPLYVQFYITARCNLTCEQCNIIYANSDVRECTLEEVERIAANLRELGVAIVLLTGGEPFVRKDLPQIIAAFVKAGLHVRMQTNGLATEEQLARCVEAGARDISISLDSLRPGLQDSINGGFPGSWRRALETISKVTRLLPKEDSFAAFGCVLSPRNVEDVEDVVRFGSAIGWYTSLVPIHITDAHRPMNFRTYDKSLAFTPADVPRVDALLDRLHGLKERGFLLYDSEEYVADIRRFVRGEPIRWRRRNDGRCDSPGLYFALLPNGDFAVCCDHRLPGPSVPAQDPGFPAAFRSGEFRRRVEAVTTACEGCMFGSYPEVTISARYWSAFLERTQVFLSRPAPKPWPLSVDQLEEIAAGIRARRPEAPAA